MESLKDMLNILYVKLDETDNSGKLILTRPILKKVGTKFIWKNPKDFLIIIQRDSDHFIDYLGKETNGNANWKTGSKRDGIIFNIKTDVIKIDNWMKKYIEKYVKCIQCNKYNSQMIKDNSVRKCKITCNCCGAGRYI